MVRTIICQPLHGRTLKQETRERSVVDQCGGCCTLSLACSKGHLKVVQFLMAYLVSQGEDVRAKKNEGIQIASEHGHDDVIKYLQELKP